MHCECLVPKLAWRELFGVKPQRSYTYLISNHVSSFYLFVPTELNRVCNFCSRHWMLSVTNKYLVPKVLQKRFQDGIWRQSGFYKNPHWSGYSQNCTRLRDRQKRSWNTDKIKNRHIFRPSVSAERSPNINGGHLINLNRNLLQQNCTTSHMQRPQHGETLMYNSAVRDTAHSTINRDV